MIGGGVRGDALVMTSGGRIWMLNVRVAVFAVGVVASVTVTVKL